MSHTPTLPERLREVSTNIRRMPMPLVSFVPLLSKAADEIDALRRQRDALLAASKHLVAELEASLKAGIMPAAAYSGEAIRNMGQAIKECE